MAKAPKRRRTTAGRKPPASGTGRREVLRLDDGRRVMMRHARTSDGAGIVRLYNSVAAEVIHITPEKYPWPAEVEGQLIAEQKREGSGRFVAVSNRRIIAECSIFRDTAPKRNHTATCQLVVLKAFRGRGIGRRLLGTALAWARDTGIEKVTLTVFSSNEAARKLYETFGFEVEGVLKGQVRIDGEDVDDILMAKFL